MLETVQSVIILFYLLPGFIGYFFFIMLSDRKPEDSFHKISIVLTITFFSAGIVKACTKSKVLPSVSTKINDLPEVFDKFFDVNFLYVTLLAVFIGLCGALVGNKGLIYKFLGRLTGTTKTGKYDVWQQAFTRIEKQWCRVWLENGDRIVGWPRYYSHDGLTPSLFLESATRFVKSDRGFERKKIEGKGILIVDFKSVLSVDFMEGNRKGDRK